MGRQVNFFMDRGDETIFLDHAKGSGNVELFPDVLTTSHLEPVKALPNNVSTKLDEKRFFLFNHDISSRLFSIQSRDGGHYSFDWMKSSAIEFQRCPIQEGVMYPGRIFADFSSYDPQSKSVRAKEPEFEEWYESMAEWIRKAYHPIRLYNPGRSKVPSWILYAGPGAQNFFKTGGKFSLNPPGVRTIILVDMEGTKTILDDH